MAEPQSTRRRCPLVATRSDAGSRELGERGIELLDMYGDLSFIHDQDIPQVISLLARHLSGETLRFTSQEPVQSEWDSDELDEELVDVEQQLASLDACRQAICDLIQTQQDAAAALPVMDVSYVSFAELLTELKQQGDQRATENTP